MNSYTREQLIEAMESYNAEAIAHPENFAEITTEPGVAEGQVDKLLSFIKA